MPLMFQAAYAIARQFTWPVVLSRRTIGGDCSSSIGAFVIVNDEGWIVTAHHIAELLGKMIAGANKARAHETQEAQIRNDSSLDHKARKKKLASLGHLSKDETDRCSAWWGKDGLNVAQFHSLPHVDLAVGKLEPFDKNWVPTYPTFKDPAKNFEPGTSLCKLGFPFHQITPTWNAAKDSFELPPGALPMPLFPMDGILTRFAEIRVVGGPAPPYPLRFLETSTPGLRGQSGGPIFDTRGTIWGIQVRTAHLSLGFDPPIPNAKPGEKEHQFLNVGLGVHPETIIGFLRDNGVKIDVSAY
jgi:trypsin-like peptidase